MSVSAITKWAVVTLVSGGAFAFTIATHEDGSVEPELFETQSQAMTARDEHIQDLEDAIDADDLDDDIETDLDEEVIVVEVQDHGDGSYTVDGRTVYLKDMIEGSV